MHATLRELVLRSLYCNYWLLIEEVPYLPNTSEMLTVFPQQENSQGQGKAAHQINTRKSQLTIHKFQNLTVIPMCSNNFNSVLNSEVVHLSKDRHNSVWLCPFSLMPQMIQFK